MNKITAILISAIAAIFINPSVGASDFRWMPQNTIIYESKESDTIGWISTQTASTEVPIAVWVVHHHDDNGEVTQTIYSSLYLQYKWLKAQAISNAAYIESAPILYASSDHVMAVWVSSNCYACSSKKYSLLSSSLIEGKWTKPRVIAAEKKSIYGISLAINHSGLAVCVWREGNGVDFKIKSSTSRGSTWSESTTVDVMTEDRFELGVTSIAASGEEGFISAWPVGYTLKDLSFIYHFNGASFKGGAWSNVQTISSEYSGFNAGTQGSSIWPNITALSGPPEISGFAWQGKTVSALFPTLNGWGSSEETELDASRGGLYLSQSSRDSVMALAGSGCRYGGGRYCYGYSPVMGSMTAINTGLWAQPYQIMPASYSFQAATNKGFTTTVVAQAATPNEDGQWFSARSLGNEWKVEAIPNMINGAQWAGVQARISTFEDDVVTMIYAIGNSLYSKRGTSNYHEISILKNGSGIVADSLGVIHCGDICKGIYESGEVVRLYALVDPESGYEFSGWSGACSGKDECVVNMGADKLVGANFSALPSYTLALTRSINGNVTSQPSGIDCGIGAKSCKTRFYKDSTVTLTAQPREGFMLKRWKGCTSADGNICQVTIGRNNMTVTPVFSPLPKYKMTNKKDQVWLCY